MAPSYIASTRSPKSREAGYRPTSAPTSPGAHASSASWGSWSGGANCLDDASPKSRLFCPSPRLQAEPTCIEWASQQLLENEDAIQELACRKPVFSEALARHGLQPSDLQDASGLPLDRRALLLAMSLEDASTWESHSETLESSFPSRPRGAKLLQLQMREQHRISARSQRRRASHCQAIQQRSDELAGEHISERRQLASAENARTQRVDDQRRSVEGWRQRRVQRASTKWEAAVNTASDIAAHHVVDLEALHSVQAERSQRSIGRRDIAHEQRQSRKFQTATVRAHEAARVRRMQEYEREKRAIELQEDADLFRKLRSVRS